MRGKTMKVSLYSEINRGTPNVTIYSNQGLAVRQLSYCRREAGGAAETRINLQRYDSAGQLKSSIDPRLSSSTFENSSSIVPNQQQQMTLSGTVLKSDHVDAGSRVLFSDVRGLALWSWDSRGTEKTFDYDKLCRLTAVHEKGRGKASACTERLRYGTAADAGQKNNCVGQLIEHLDTAGRRSMPEYNLLGIVRQEQRTFLKSEAIAHWTDNAEENDTALEVSSYRSGVETNPLGEILTQIDARGNQCHSQFAVSGQLRQVTLELSSGTQALLVKDCAYHASGQPESETLANGVQLYYDYEPDTQRLKEKRAIRLSDGKLLQSLYYRYDSVGNILSIADQAAEVEYYKNARAKSVSHYVYDSLYQLISAEGIESEQAGREQSNLPNAIRFGNNDASRLVHYQRNYDYDAGGNLFEIKHRGASTCTRELTIDTRSNRGIEKRSSGPMLEESFDGNGNLLYLKIDQPLTWDTRNQLQETIQVERADTLSDKETYLYDGQGMRIQKTRIYLAESQIHTERVRYLSGLELREHWQTDRQGQNKQIIEELHLISAQAGGVPVKVLHWETKNPEGIENDSFYFSLSDHGGSNQIELNNTGEIASFESYYPYGGTAIWSTITQIEADYKYYRYSGKERDYSGLYYYGYRYYMPWLGRWLNADPAGTVDGLNEYRMAKNNPVLYTDSDGQQATDSNGEGTKNRFRDIFSLAVFGSRKSGNGTTSSFTRAKKITLAIMGGLVLAGIAGAIVATAGLALAAALIVVGAAFLVGAVVGWNLDKITSKMIEIFGSFAQGKSMNVNVAMGVTTAVATASLHGGGTDVVSLATAGAFGGFFGYSGYLAGKSSQGLSGAHGAGMGVGVVNILAERTISIAMMVSAAAFGGLGGYLTGMQGSAQAGNNAAMGSFIGGMLGRRAGRVVSHLRMLAGDFINNSVTGRSIAGMLERYAGRAVSHVQKLAKDFVGWYVGEHIASLLISGGSSIAAQPLEWVGSGTGAAIGGLGTTLAHTSDPHFNKRIRQIGSMLGQKVASLSRMIALR
jgi:insecticidal toxin complex protein TccC